MDKRTTGIIATVVAVLLCGCPGFFALCWGLIAAFASQIPGADINIGGSSDPSAAMGAGIGALCLGVIAIAIPIVVAYFTLIRNRASAATPVDVYNAPPPPPPTA
jgi:hypothetical protein